MITKNQDAVRELNASELDAVNGGLVVTVVVACVVGYYATKAYYQWLKDNDKI